MLTFAIGDTHGCFDKLTELLDQCHRFASGRPSRFIFLGDYIDRGPDSRGVIQTVLDLQTADPGHVIALAGNHEDLFCQTDTSAGMGRWIANGGGAMLRSYGVTARTGLPPAHIDFLRNRPTSFDDGQRLFVHAGVRPGIPLKEQTRDDLLWIREPFLSSNADHGRLIVHGHTPLKSGEPDVRSNRINLDTGAVFGRALTAAVFTADALPPINFIQAR